MTPEQVEHREVVTESTPLPWGVAVVQINDLGDVAYEVRGANGATVLRTDYDYFGYHLAHHIVASVNAEGSA